MNLEAKMAATRAMTEKRIPPELQAIMHSATERLRGSGILDRVIKPNAKARGMRCCARAPLSTPARTC